MGSERSRGGGVTPVGGDNFGSPVGETRNDGVGTPCGLSTTVVEARVEAKL